jgi:hypothetical protein
MENKSNIAKAILAVMAAVKGIDKSMTVGTGANSYKGVSDQDVKQAIGLEMQKNGLCIIPISTEAKTQVDRWEETNNYGTKQKQQVFTEVFTKYLLLHESGESMEISGYGHGVDSQDKSAGKATTYALKYALLYTFLVPTGKIDDADAEHSETKEVPAPKPAAKPEPKEKPELLPGTEAWDKVVAYLLTDGATLSTVEKKYNITSKNKGKLTEQASEVLA